MFFFGSSKNLVGLDIGSSAIKLVELEELKKGQGYELLSFGIERIPSEIIVDGSIFDASVVIDAINKLFDENDLNQDKVATGLAGRAVIIKRIELPSMSMEELEESIEWEAEQHIPFEIEEVNLDYEILGESPDGESMDTLLVAVKKDIISDYTSVISQAGKTPKLVDAEAFALQNAYEMNYTLEGDKVVALIDIGASVMIFNILDEGNPVFWRNVTVGGDNFTDSIRREMDLTFDQAEELKKGNEVEDISPEDVQPILDEVSGEVAGEINKTIDFFRQTTVDKKVDKIVLSGGSCRIRGFSEMLESEFGVEVEELNPFRNIDVDSPDFSTEFVNENAPAAAIAVGLALRKEGD